MVRTSYVYDYKALSENLTRGNGGRDSNTGSTRNPEQGPFWSLSGHQLSLPRLTREGSSIKSKQSARIIQSQNTALQLIHPHGSSPHRHLKGFVHAFIGFFLGSVGTQLLTGLPCMVVLGCRERQYPNLTPLFLPHQTLCWHHPPTAWDRSFGCSGAKLYSRLYTYTFGSPFLSLRTAVKALCMASSRLCHWWGHQEGDMICQSPENREYLSLTAKVRRQLSPIVQETAWRARDQPMWSYPRVPLPRPKLLYKNTILLTHGNEKTFSPPI